MPTADELNKEYILQNREAHSMYRDRPGMTTHLMIANPKAFIGVLNRRVKILKSNKSFVCLRCIITPVRNFQDICDICLEMEKSPDELKQQCKHCGCSYPTCCLCGAEKI